MESQDQPATKGDLQALEQRFDGRMDALEQRLRDHTAETVRESETRLLQAFYSFAEANDR